MRVLVEIGAALWWLAVIGGGLAFLAWVGDRLHARDVEDHPSEGGYLLRNVNGRQYTKPWPSDGNVVAALRDDDGWVGCDPDPESLYTAQVRDGIEVTQDAEVRLRVDLADWTTRTVD